MYIYSALHKFGIALGGVLDNISINQYIVCKSQSDMGLWQLRCLITRLNLFSEAHRISIPLEL